MSNLWLLGDTIVNLDHVAYIWFGKTSATVVLARDNGRSVDIVGEFSPDDFRAVVRLEKRHDLG